MRIFHCLQSHSKIGSLPIVSTSAEVPLTRLCPGSKNRSSMATLLPVHIDSLAAIPKGSYEEISLNMIQKLLCSWEKIPSCTSIEQNLFSKSITANGSRVL